jgi:hypothetical protein
VTRRDLTEDTAHWGGPSPWGAGVDRSTAERFMATCDHNRCATIVRAYQNFHMDSREWQDIAYSSLVCPHGHRYEGRGHDVRTAANGTTAGNNVSHATCYIAGTGDPFTDAAKLAYADESNRLDGLTKGHRDWKLTECPGDKVYAWVHGGQPLPATPPEDDMPYTKAELLELIETGVENALAVRHGHPPGMAVDQMHARVEEAVENALAVRLGRPPGKAVDQMHARVRDGVNLALDKPDIQDKIKALIVEATTPQA